MQSGAASIWPRRCSEWQGRGIGAAWTRSSCGLNAASRRGLSCASPARSPEQGVRDPGIYYSTADMHGARNGSSFRRISASPVTDNARNELRTPRRWHSAAAQQGRAGAASAPSVDTTKAICPDGEGIARRAAPLGLSCPAPYPPTRRRRIAQLAGKSRGARRPFGPQARSLELPARVPLARPFAR